jgi:hypothetical protein
MTNGLKIVAVALAAAALVGGLWLFGHLGLALLAGILGLLWLAADWRAPEGRPLLDGLGLAGFCALAACSVFYGLPGWLGLAEVLLALAGWDLARFRRRLSEVTAPQPAPEALEEAEEPEEGPQVAVSTPANPAAAAASAAPLPLFSGSAAAARMERIHLSRLGLALGGGLVLGLLALVVHVTLSFAVALVLGIVAIYALSRVVRGING